MDGWYFFGEYTLLWVWFIAFLLLLALEFVTEDLVSIWFALGSLITMIFSFFIKDSLLITFIIFTVISVALLLLTRPLVIKYFKKTTIKTNADALIGKFGIVTEDITEVAPGEVKLEGKRWTAVSSESIFKDEKVVALAIEGVKLIVKRIDE